MSCGLSPLVFAPGEAFQFDWSEDWVVIGAERTKLMVAQFKLCHSRAFMLCAYPLQSHEMLFDAHNHCLAALGGVPRRRIYDNMKTDRMIGREELGVCEARVVLVVPDGNAEYRDTITSPALRAAFPNATTVEEVTRATMNAPDRDFAVVSQHAIAEVVRARCGEAVRHWSEYHLDRYGW